MKAYESGILELTQTLGHYLPECRGTNKENLQINKLLLHEAGLIPYIPYYKETLSANGMPDPEKYVDQPEDSFSASVAGKLFIRNDLRDTFYQRILQSAIKPGNSYVYSDLDFIFLGKVIEKVSGMKLNEYMATHFYNPMRLDDIAFLPNNRFTAERIVASTYEKGFRNQLLKGDVHDPGAAIMGGVSGHAGLFGSAAAIAALMQMLLDTGVVNGNQYLQKNTIQLFTSYQSWNSRRGYGFDKPERVTADKKVPYPAASASPSCFGHTGFTGTATWADPATKLVFVFLSNRLMPEDNDALLKKNIRQKILQAVYEGFSDATVE